MLMATGRDVTRRHGEPAHFLLRGGGHEYSSVAPVLGTLPTLADTDPALCLCARAPSCINYDLASGMAGATHDRKHFLQGHTWQRQEHISGQFIGKPNPTRLNPPVPVIINLGPAADECGAEQVADVHAYDT